MSSSPHPHTIVCEINSAKLGKVDILQVRGLVRTLSGDYCEQIRFPRSWPGVSE